jgi:hypothetical protein
LVCRRELSFDATKVKANAGLDAVPPRFAVEANLAALFASAEASSGADEEMDGPTMLPVTSPLKQKRR